MNFITKQIEKKLGVDLNGDGVVGSGHKKSKGHGSSGVGGLLNKLEKVTGIDLNGDGRIGESKTHDPYQNEYNAPAYPPNNNPYGSAPYPPAYNPYHAPGYPPNPQPSAAGASNNFMNKLEKVTGVDLNGDGRIGGGAGHGQPYPRHY